MSLWLNEKLSLLAAAVASEVVEEDHEAEDRSTEEEEEEVVQEDLVDKATGVVPTPNATTTISHGAQHVTGVKHRNQKDWMTEDRTIADRAEDMTGEDLVADEAVVVR